MHPPWQNPCHGADGAHLIEGPTVHALAVLQDLLPHQGLGEGLEAVGKQFRACGDSLANGIVFFQTSDRFRRLCFHRIERLITLLLGLLKLLEHLTDGFGAVLFEVSGHGRVFFRSLRFHLLNAEILQQALLGLDQFADGFVAEVDRLDHILFRQLIRSGFHHHHAVGCSGNDEVEIAPFNFPVAGVQNEVIPQQADADCSHRTVERDPGEQCCDRCARHGQHIGRNAFVKGQASGHHLEVIPQPGWEQRPHRPVDQSGDQGGSFRWPTFPSHVAAWDASRCVETLLVVADEGKEVDSLSACGACGGDEYGGVAAFDQY